MVLLIRHFFLCYRLEEFLKKEVDLELSTLPDFEERIIDFSEVEQLMNSINTIPGTLPIWLLFKTYLHSIKYMN